MGWVKYENDIKKRELAIDLAEGWILDKPLEGYSIGTVITKKIIADLKERKVKYITVHFKKLEVGDQILFPLTEDEFTVLEINGKKEKRTCVLERLEKGFKPKAIINTIAPEYVPIKKKGGKSTRGGLAYSRIWIDEDLKENEELGFEPEENIDDDNDDYWDVL